MSLKRVLIVTLPAIAVLWVTMAQSSWAPYLVSPGMSVLNPATRPRPVAAPTAAAPNDADYGYAVSDWRLVCEQWTGNRWVVIHIRAKQCLP
jgi:hypothetical protein